MKCFVHIIMDIKVYIFLFILNTATPNKLLADGCIETFPSMGNSRTECSNITTACSVSCTEGYIFYDGNTTKNFSCSNEGQWSPSVPGSGCVGRTYRWYWIQMRVVHFSSYFAVYCEQVHNSAVLKKEVNITQSIFDACNLNDTLAVGKIEIAIIASGTASFDLKTTLEIVITDSSVTKTMVQLCADVLERHLADRILVLHDSTVTCGDRIHSNITINMNKTEIDLKQCNESFVVTNSGEHDYCVFDVPVVGGTHFRFNANTSEYVTLNCEILFGTSILAVYWTLNNKNITISSDKFDGGTREIPSLTINKLSTEDNGKYVCHVVNIHGRGASPSITLEVIPISDATTQQTSSEAVIIHQTTSNRIESTPTSLDTSQDTMDIGHTTTKDIGSTNVTPDTSIITTTISQTTAKNRNESEDSKNILYIAIGAGCGGFLIIIIILVIVIKSCRKGSHSKKHRADKRKSDGSNDADYDGLKDNILYVQSDDGLKDNILYVPSKEHDIIDGNYSSVDLERSPLKRLGNDGNYNTVDLEPPTNNLASSVLNEIAKNKHKTEFENKAFDVNGEEDIKHIAAPDGSSNIYAVVDKKKNSSGDTEDSQFPKLEITYAVVDKTRKK